MSLELLKDGILKSHKLFEVVFGLLDLRVYENCCGKMVKYIFICNIL